MATSHWTWLGHEEIPDGRTEPVRIGKRNLINNYCIGVQSNWPACTVCHAGYGWEDASFDFASETNVDCLVCHEQTGLYVKAPDQAGRPAADTDLVAVARSVGRPTRANCGACHFRGGGGDAVKHGDLDGTFFFPSEHTDVHMGRHDFECVDCHVTRRHELRGHAISVSTDANPAHRITCEGCHTGRPHTNERLNAHTSAVSCQACHIPRMAVGTPTKMEWDWSTAGRDLGIDDPHAYLKIKGSFRYAQNIEPEYYWYNGESERYLMGDGVDSSGVTVLNRPGGAIDDPRAKIWPFKVHRGRQPYDTKNRYLLVPQTAGPGGFWTDFDWDQALALGSKVTGLDYSGQFGFTRTDMYWPMTHMVAPAEAALQCTDCHGRNGRIEWKRLGYDGDPAFRGNPRSALIDAAQGASR
jgi:octaheme c-type cytochrome (tetrathionate reductase family)